MFNHCLQGRDKSTGQWHSVVCTWRSRHDFHWWSWWWQFWWAWCSSLCLQSFAYFWCCSSTGMQVFWIRQLAFGLFLLAKFWVVWLMLLMLADQAHIPLYICCILFMFFSKCMWNGLIMILTETKIKIQCFDVDIFKTTASTWNVFYDYIVFGVIISWWKRNIVGEWMQCIPVNLW